MYNQKRQIDFTAEDSIKSKNDAENTLRDMNTLEEDVARKIDLVNLIVSEVQSLVLNIELGTGAMLDSALNEAKEILKKIQDVSFVKFRDNAVDQADQANILVSEMQQYNIPVSNLSFAASDLSNRIKNASAKMDDLLDIAQTAQESASMVDKLNRENRIAAQTDNLDVVKNFTTEAEEDLEAGEKLNKNASQFFNDAQANIVILRKCHFFFISMFWRCFDENNRGNGGKIKIFPFSETNVIGDTAAQLNNTIVHNDQMLSDLTEPIRRAQSHAAYLYNRSLELDSLLTDTRNTNAVRAVSAYRDIEIAIQAAKDAANDAMNAAENATLLVRGLIYYII